MLRELWPNDDNAWHVPTMCTLYMYTIRYDIRLLLRSHKIIWRKDYSIFSCSIRAIQRKSLSASCKKFFVLFTVMLVLVC